MLLVVSLGNFVAVELVMSYFAIVHECKSEDGVFRFQGEIGLR